MSHITFYRKYRSQNFEEIAGQAHIIQTLQNAIQFDRLSHAYIFSGPRGTGKTSTARILAKVLNCKTKKDGAPCQTCDICKKITSGRAVDIFEIDAASHTGVDNIRALNEQVNFAPVECEYKLYIIDEAHMLSTGAFNALLKTLEEPPQNTIFILATTEPHKIPITIHSRCQHLNFKKLTTDDILKQLRYISDKETLTIDEKSLITIAKNASGCMRDAISILDQIYAFKGNEITFEDVIFILGATNFDNICDLFRSFLSKNNTETITKLNQIYADGINIHQFMAEILNFFKQLVFIKMNLEDQLHLDQARLTELRQLADTTTLSDLQNYLETFSKTEMELRWFPNPEMLLQIRFLVLLNQSAESTQTISEQPMASQPKPPFKIEKPTQKEPPTTQPKETPPLKQKTYTPANQMPQTEPVAPKQSQPATEKKAPSKDSWNTFIDNLKSKSWPLFSILKDATPVQSDNQTITVSLKQNYKFFRDKLVEEKNKTLIESLLKEAYQEPMSLTLAEQTTPESDTKTENTPKENNTTTKKQSKKINDIIELFEGTKV